MDDVLWAAERLSFSMEEKFFNSVVFLPKKIPLKVKRDFRSKGKACATGAGKVRKRISVETQRLPIGHRILVKLGRTYDSDIDPMLELSI